ncbi:hypothetical protein ATCC90586_008146 [Pythium insidiosum]|nr:hypothetical protein ATCC90586_008146 [Pythium insidiosum]
MAWPYLLLTLVAGLLGSFSLCLSRRRLRPSVVRDPRPKAAASGHWAFIHVLDELLHVTQAAQRRHERQSRAVFRRCAHCRRTIINRAIDISAGDRRFCSLDCRSSDSLVRSVDSVCDKLLSIRPIASSSCAPTLVASSSNSSVDAALPLTVL